MIHWILKIHKEHIINKIIFVTIKEIYIYIYI